MPCRMPALSARPVIRMNGMAAVGASLRNQASVKYPSTFSMLMSQRIRSGNSFRARSMPSAPLMASITSKPFCFRARRIISRNHSSSSITRIFFTASALPFQHESCLLPALRQRRIFPDFANETGGLFPLLQGHIMTERAPGVDLPRPADAALGVFHDLLVIRNPARHPANRKNHGEHLHRNADRPHDDATVKIHVGI